MVNYACAFSQSESGKYFQWIIMFITSHSPKFQICRLGSHRNFACVKTPLFKPFQKWPNMVNFTTENKTYCFRIWSAFLDTDGDVVSSTHSTCNYNLVPWWRRQRKQITNSRPFNRDYYSCDLLFWNFSPEYFAQGLSLQRGSVGKHTTLTSYQNAVCSNDFFFFCWVDYALEGSTFKLRKCDFCRFFHRLRVVPHFSSGIVERAKRERAWKSPHARKGDTRVVYFFQAERSWHI